MKTTNIVFRSQRRIRSRWAEGFTLVELLVVIGIIGLLAAMVLPALSKAKESGYRAVCINNEKQMQLAWSLYTVDNSDRLALNYYQEGNVTEIFGGAVYPVMDGGKYIANFGAPWVAGVLNYGGGGDNTNAAVLVDRRFSSFAAYIQTPVTYKCPDDRSTVHTQNGTFPRVRSYALNMPIGGPGWVFAGGTPATVSKMSQIGVGVNFDPAGFSYDPTLAPLCLKQWLSTVVPPSQQFCFVDAQPDYLRGAELQTSLPYSLTDLPAHYHNNSGALSFADGHVEVHRWVSPALLTPIVPGVDTTQLNPVRVRGTPDGAWLTSHTLYGNLFPPFFYDNE